MAGHRHRLHDDIHRTPDVSHISNPDVTHEESDVAVGPIAKFVFGLFVFGVIVCFLMWLLFNFFERRAKETELPSSPLARRGAETLPPEPRLQAAPGFGVEAEGRPRADLSLKEPQAEYQTVLKAWKDELDNGWVDQSTGVKHLPVSAAMDLYLQQQQARTKNQPAGQQTPPQGQQGSGGGGNAAAPSATEEMPSGSSSGQQTEKKHQ